MDMVSITLIFKVIILTCHCQACHKSAPEYLHDLIIIYPNTCNSNSQLLVTH